MTNDMVKPFLPPVGEFLSEIMNRYTRRAGLLLSLSLLQAASSFVLALVTVAFAPIPATVISLLLAVPLLIMTVLGSLGLYAAVVWPEQANNWRSAIRLGIGFFWPNLTTFLLYFLMVLVGFLVIFPGIFFAVSFSLGGFLVMKERLRNWAALNRSRELIRGRWWAVFGRMLALGAVIIGVSFGVGIFFGFIFAATPLTMQKFLQDALEAVVQWLAGPISVLFNAVLYDHLLRSRPKETATV